ncbi:MAG: ABC transporter substrate-binding protein [Clostridiales bacterium]|nr:ABC transporter substrate-binding protein [Clostridiales bacterium]
MKARKKGLKLMILAAGAAGFLVIQSAGSSSAQKLTLTDNLGRTVEVPFRAEEILSLQPEITRIIVALGARDRLVGLDYFLRRDDHLFKIIYPEQARLPVVSRPDDSVNKEAIAALSPDVIFASPSEFLVPDSIQRSLGIPVVALSSQGSFGRLLNEIELVGRITGLEARAKELVDYFLENIADIARAMISVSAEEKPKVYLAFWSSLLRTPVSYEPVSAAGGENVAAGLLPSSTGSPGTVVTIEQIIKWDPDIILVHGNFLPRERKVTVEQVLADKRLSSVKAVRNRQVFYTFGYWYWWDPAEVAVETLYLANLFHQEKFRDIDLEAAGNTIFEKFYGQAGLFSKLCEVLAFHDWIKKK